MYIGDKVKIIGNNSQGIRHYNEIGDVGVIDLVRTGMLIKGIHKKVEARRVRVNGGGNYVVAVEDMTRV